MKKIFEIVSAEQQRNNNQVFFDKQVRSAINCRKPWQNLIINQEGSSYICESPAWLPKSIGSILEYDDIFDLLNNSTARRIRSEIDMGRYGYCNNNICGYYFSSIALPTQYKAIPSGEFTELTDSQLTESSTVKSLPTSIIIDFDYTCNFVCPSCRTELINTNGSDSNRAIVEKIKHLLLDKYSDQPVTIRWAGGEPFISRAYLDLWEYISKSGKTNIRNIIQTNGSYIKKKADLLEKFLPYVDSIWVSFDAGTADTYSKTRTNGNWYTLLDNCKFLRQLINQSRTRIKLNSSFVTQLDNYKEIKQYCEVANQLGFDGININNMWNWGTWSMEDFARRNVFSPSHPEYNELIKIITDVKSENYGNKVRPYNWKNI